MVEPGEGTPATVILRLPASPAHVRTARLVAAAMARRSGVDEALLDEVRLAVGEACARAVRQHERYGVQEPVTVEFIDHGKFAVAVIDRAPVASISPAGAASTAAAQLDDLVSMPLGPATGAFASGAAAGPARPDLPASNGLNATADSLGLALLDAVVQDLAVTPAEAGTGTRVSMSWPLED
jgi:serine/threonine-protein kinase RsbW